MYDSSLFCASFFGVLVHTTAKWFPPWTIPLLGKKFRSARLYSIYHSRISTSEIFFDSLCSRYEQMYMDTRVIQVNNIGIFSKNIFVFTHLAINLPPLKFTAFIDMDAYFCLCSSSTSRTTILISKWFSRKRKKYWRKLMHRLFYAFILEPYGFNRSIFLFGHAIMHKQYCDHLTQHLCADSGVQVQLPAAFLGRD